MEESRLTEGITVPRLPTKQIPVELIRTVFREQDGKLFWLARPVEHFSRHKDYLSWNARFAGKEAGTISHLRSGTRFVIRLNGVTYLRSRLIWAYYHGASPAIIDHANRNTQDDRIENLRAANPSQNGVNAKTRTNNRSGIHGVYYDKREGKWTARIRVGRGKRLTLGYFKNPEDAKQAYKEASRVHHGDFAPATV